MHGMIGPVINEKSGDHTDLNFTLGGIKSGELTREKRRTFEFFQPLQKLGAID
jgi:hypothetical protein